MQPQKTGAPAPNIDPETPSRPELVKPDVRPPRRGWWVLLVGVIALGAVALYWKTRPVEPAKSGPAQVAAVRTVKVTAGGLDRTLRLTGTTAAKNFASLVAPQMRGRGGQRQVTMTVQGGVGGAGRGGGGGGGGGGGSQGGGGGSRDGGGGGGGGSSSSSAESTTAGSSSTSGGSGGGTAIGVSGTSGAIGASSSLVSSVSRFSTSTRSTSSSSRTTSTSSSSAMGSSGMGSTSSSLMGGGGGGGGDFQLVLEHLVPGGSNVKKGQIVAEFDRQFMLQRLDDFRASHGQNDAAFRGLESNLRVERKAQEQIIEAAKADLDKAKLDLQTSPVRSAIVAEQLKLAVDEADAYYKQLLSEVKFRDLSWAAQLKRAQLDMNQEALELQRAEANADKMVIRAPMDGIAVMSTIFRGGEFGQIQQGDQVAPGMMYMRIVDQSSMVINASVSQADIEQVRVGAKAQVHFDAYPDLVLPATLYSIGAIAKANGMRPNYVTQVPVVLKLDRIDPRVIPDLSVSAELVIAREATGTLAPRAAIFTEEGTGKPIAFVKAGTGWEKRDLELGLANNLYAIVRSGLRPGEIVASEWPIAEKPVENKK